MNAESITYPQGIYNKPGINNIFYASSNDILSMPSLAVPETAINMASLVEMTTAIVMKSGKSFKDIYSTLGEGKLDWAKVGNRDSVSWENMLEFSMPNDTPEFIGFCAYAGNERFILLVRQPNGRVRLVGSLDSPAFFDDGKGTSGDKPSTARATKVTFKDSQNTPAPIYTPALTSLLIPAP